MSLGRKVSFPQFLHIHNSVLSIKQGSRETIFVTDAISNSLKFTYSEDKTPSVSYKNDVSNTGC